MLRHINAKKLRMSRLFSTFVVEIIKEMIMKKDNISEETRKAWREAAHDWLEALEETRKPKASQRERNSQYKTWRMYYEHHMTYRLYVHYNDGTTKATEISASLGTHARQIAQQFLQQEKGAVRARLIRANGETECNFHKATRTERELLLQHTASVAYRCGR